MRLTSIQSASKNVLFFPSKAVFIVMWTGKMGTGRKEVNKRMKLYKFLYLKSSETSD